MRGLLHEILPSKEVAELNDDESEEEQIDDCNRHV
jgi:hypothetical protein